MFGTPETQKAYELSYATFRVAALVRKPDLKERLERQAAIILERAASGDLAIGEPLETLRALIMLSEGIGEIRYVNAKVLLRELGNLERIVKAAAPPSPGYGGQVEEFDIERMFSTTATGKAGVEDSIRRIQERRKEETHPSPGFGGQAEEAARHAPKVDSVVPTNAVTNPAKPETRQNGNGSAKLTTSGNGNGSASSPQGGNGNGNGEARASAIYAKIQRGNASIKDLLAEFNGVSERTLRYDLQRLVEQGRIERVGSGGPGTYYRLPAAAPLLVTPSQPLISETTLH